MMGNTVNFFSNLMQSDTRTEPKVGMKCCEIYYTDRRVCTITAITKNTVTVMRNEVKTLDYYGCKYKILDNLVGKPVVFSKRKNGKYVRKGEAMHNGVGLAINCDRHYVDPHF